MATATPEKPVPTSSEVPPDLKIYSHSPLLYWWPVWAVGFLMALWTWLDNYHMALVPENTVAQANQLIAPEGEILQGPSVHMARSKWPGVIFTLTLLLVVLLSHVWLRGPWALFIAASLAAAVFLGNWLDWWHPLYRWFRLLHVHINLGGYLVISAVLFIAWALAIFVFDRRTYMIFSVGQIRIRDELGDQEKVFDTHSIAFEKRPYDWFRWLVGCGAGDMILRAGGPNPQVIELSNVVRVGKWLHAMEARLRTRDVV
jgi:hypothetical protein